MRNRIRQLLDAIAPTINSILTALLDDGRSSRKATRFAESLEPRLLLSAVTLQGGNGSDTFYIRNDPETDEILLWHNTALEDNPARYSGHDIDSFVIDAGNGDDTLTLDNSDGDPLRSGALVFHGEGGNDTLVFTGPSTVASRTIYMPAHNQANAGSMRTGFKLMSFTGVESVSTSHFNRSTLITPGSNDSIAIDSPSATQNMVSGQSDAVAFPPITFSNIATFTLDAAANDVVDELTSGDDAITISSNGMRATGLTNLQVLAGDGANTLDVNGGTTNLDTGAGLGGANLTLTLRNSAVVNLTKTQHIYALVMRNSSRLNLPSGLFKILFLDYFSFPVGNTAKIDIADNDLVVHDVQFDFVRSQILRAYQSSANPHWQGPGITSSTAAPGQTAIGFIRASTQPPTRLFDGQPISDTDILVKFAYEGDNNLDNEVSTSDLIDLYSNWGGTGKTWIDGDFNYDSSVTIADATDQSTNYGIPKPAVTLSGDDAVNEGSSYTLDLLAMSTYTDSQNNTHSYGPVSYYTVYWGDGSADAFPQTTDSPDTTTHMITLPVTHTYADDSGQTSYAISVFAKGTQMNYYAGSKNVTVDNVAPTLILGGDGGIVVGAAFLLTLDASDPGDDIITSWNIDWGDGTNTLGLSSEPAPQSHTYPIGLNNVTITVETFDEDGGPYVFSEPISIFAVPTPPAMLHASESSPGHIEIAWADTSNNETGFSIALSTDNQNFREIAIVEAGVTSYQYNSALQNTTYYFRVLAVNGAARSETSSVSLVTTPAAPTWISLSKPSWARDPVHLLWESTASLTGMLLQKRVPGDDWQSIYLGGIQVNYNDSDTVEGTVYEYRLQATNAGGDSPFSEIRSAFEPLNEPSGLMYDDHGNVYWLDESEHETGFVIEGKSSGGYWHSLALVPANLSPSPAATQFHLNIPDTIFRVRAYNANGFSTFCCVGTLMWPWPPELSGQLDLDVDSDNNNGLGLPDRSDQEDSQEDEQGIDSHPGKVLLVNDGDLDNDGVVDFFDGFGLDQNLPEYATSYGVQFVPLVLDTPFDVFPGSFRITYDASDPNEIPLESPYQLPASGKIRIWTKDSDQPRNPNKISDGGDYVAPGEYSANEIGAFYAGQDVTLYIEAVKPSEDVGDISISAQMSGWGSDDFTYSDEVRLTATRIQILANDSDGLSQTEVANFVGTGIPGGIDTETDGSAPGAMQSYVVKVFDPRSTITHVNIAGQALTLTGGPGEYTTAPFVVLNSANQALLDANEPYALGSGEYIVPSEIVGNLQIIHIDDSSATLQYNPSKKAPVAEALKPTRNDEIMAKTVTKVIEEMKEESWQPPPPALGKNPDPGAFGKEVHRRASQILGQRDGWIADVYVDNATKKIVAIGPRPANIRGTTQIDIAGLDNGYRPKVGDTWVPASTDVYEIKASVSQLKIAERQVERLEALSKEGNLKFVRPAEGWKNGQWIKVPSARNVVRLLEIVGLATSAWNVINYSKYDWQLEEVAEAIANAKSATDPDDRNIARLEVIRKTRDYLSNFTPPGVALDLVFVAAYEKILAEWE